MYCLYQSIKATKLLVTRTLYGSWGSNHFHLSSLAYNLSYTPSQSFLLYPSVPQTLTPSALPLLIPFHQADWAQSCPKLQVWTSSACPCFQQNTVPLNSNSNSSLHCSASKRSWLEFSFPPDWLFWRQVICFLLTTDLSRLRKKPFKQSISSCWRKCNLTRAQDPNHGKRGVLLQDYKGMDVWTQSWLSVSVHHHCNSIRKTPPESERALPSSRTINTPWQIDWGGIPKDAIHPEYHPHGKTNRSWKCTLQKELCKLKNITIQTSTHTYTTATWAMSQVPKSKWEIWHWITVLSFCWTFRSHKQHLRLLSWWGHC